MSYAIGECRAILRTLEPARFQCVVTSPPYWGLRDYGHADQLGLEPTPEQYVANMVEVFREVRRVLRPDGTLWLNIGDSYASGMSSDARTPEQRSSSSTLGPKRNGLGGSNAAHVSVSFSPRERDHGLKPKDICGIPWRLAFALQADGWWLRQDIIWAKPNPMPESVTDRCTKAHEYLFLLAKSERYFYDAKAIAEEASGREPGNVAHKGAAAYADGDEHHRTKGGLLEIGARDTRNARSVWTVASQPYPGSHFATMPPALAERCILAGSRIGDTVLDPFLGSGTVGMVAERNGRRWFGCELNPAYEPLIKQRTAQRGLFTGGAL